MFDARSLLEQLVRNGGQPQRAAEAQPGGLGGIGDILGQLGQAMSQQSRQIGPGGGQRPDQPAAGASAAGSLGDILGRIQEGLGKQGSGQGGGNLMDVLGQILGQATQGVREGAGRIDQSTGASGRMRDAVSQATGKSPEEILAQLKDLIQNNQLGAGAVLGGLGAILLGTKAGRSLTMGATKLGALALIGGLAYKALQNYQAGRPILSGGAGGTGSQLMAAPSGSGFEPDAVTHNAAQLYIRGMIAAAAADGRIDEGEQQRIIGGLTQAGLGAEAEEFLARELNNPATVEDLVRSVGSDAEAVQLFTAARIAVDSDNPQEHEFLVALAKGLGIDDALASHIDAQARAAA
jgi:uncharacterized membrane protein YebE (DUF533 family)